MRLPFGTLSDLVEACELPRPAPNDWLGLGSVTQKHFRRMGERWQAPEKTLADPATVDRLLDQLGLKREVLPPPDRPFRYVLVHGATVSGMTTRLRFLRRLLHEQLANFSMLEEVIFLTSDRPLDLSPGSPDDSPETHDCLTEIDAARALWPALGLPSLLPHDTKVTFRAASPDLSPRATTSDTMADLVRYLTFSRTPIHCLAVSSNPFIAFQDLVAQATLQESFRDDLLVTTVGPAAGPQTRMVVYLDSVARMVYEDIRLSPVAYFSARLPELVADPRCDPGVRTLAEQAATDFQDAKGMLSDIVLTLPAQLLRRARSQNEQLMALHTLRAQCQYLLLHYGKALESCWLAMDCAEPNHSGVVAWLHTRAGNFRAARNEYSEAEKQYRAALAMPASHEPPLHVALWAFTGLGNLCRQRGELTDALVWHSRRYNEARKDYDRARGAVCLAETHCELWEQTEDRTHLRSGVEYAREAARLANEDRNTQMHALQVQACLLFFDNQLDEALGCIDHCIEIRTQQLAPTKTRHRKIHLHNGHMRSYMLKQAILMRLGREVEAVEFADACRTIELLQAIKTSGQQEKAQQHEILTASSEALSLEQMQHLAKELDSHLVVYSLLSIRSAGHITRWREYVACWAIPPEGPICASLSDSVRMVESGAAAKFENHEDPLARFRIGRRPRGEATAMGPGRIGPHFPGSIMVTRLAHPLFRYEALVRPLRRALPEPAVAEDETAPRIIVCVTGALALEFFPLLCDEQCEAFLIEQYAITLVPSLGVLSALHARSKASGYELRQSVRLISPDSAVEIALPDADKEVEDICNLAATKNWECKLFRPQTSSEFKQLLLSPEFGILHFAGHGVVPQGDPGLPAGGLCLGKETLQAQDVHRTTAAGQVALLNACLTGQGSCTNNEGILGWTSVFLEIGFGAVLATMEAIGDEGARVVISHFYAHLQRGHCLDQCLRHALCSVAWPPEGRSLIPGRVYLNEDQWGAYALYGIPLWHISP